MGFEIYINQRSPRGGQLGSQAIIGTAEIVANFLGQYTQQSITSLVRGSMSRNNWDVKSVTVDTNGIAGFSTVTIVINLFSTFDTGTIGNMFMDDMRNETWGSVVVLISTRILSRSGRSANSPGVPAGVSGTIRPIGNATPVSQAGGSRTVHLRINASSFFFTNMTMSPAESIKATLQGNGWNVQTVTAIGTALYPGQEQAFDIWVNVENQYSDQTIVSNLRSQLAAVTAVGSVNFVNDTAGQISPGNNPGPAAGNGAKPSGTGTGIFDSLAGSLGVTAGVATIVVLGGLLIALKK